MNIQSAARSLGGQINGRDAIICPGPGHSRHDRSLSVRFNRDAPEGFTCHSFAGDDFAECRDHVKGLLGITPDYQAKPLQVTPSPARPANTPGAKAVWQSSVPIIGTPALDYLVSRGLDADTCINAGSLAYAARCPFKGGRVPAMVAAMTGAEVGKFAGIHRTRLNPKDKAMLGPSKGAVVRLSRDDEVTDGLHICEGIETGLRMLSVGIGPVWACLSAGGIAAFPVLSGIETLTIVADNDQNGTGQDAARECGRRWRQAGREVRALTPPQTGTDFLDWSAA